MWAHHSIACRTGKAECTLPANETEVVRYVRWSDQCAWEPNYVKGKRNKRIKGFCGCSMCTDKRERREWRRRVRHQKVRMINKEVKSYE